MTVGLLVTTLLETVKYLGIKVTRVSSPYHFFWFISGQICSLRISHSICAQHLCILSLISVRSVLFLSVLLLCFSFSLLCYFLSAIVSFLCLVFVRPCSRHVLSCVCLFMPCALLLLSMSPPLTCSQSSPCLFV